MAFIALAGCGAPRSPTTGPAKVDLPATDGLTTTALRPSQEPPPSGTTKASPFPTVAHASLPNGMGVAIVTARALPIVQVRLVVNAGTNFGTTPGIGELTARMLKDGGTRSFTSAEVLRRVETLGSDLSVHTDADGTVLGLALTTDKVSAGLDLLAQLVREPRFDPGELTKLKARMTDEAVDQARSNGSWTATHVVFHELYPDQHPYATRGLTPSAIAKIDVAKVREFFRTFFVPKNAALVIAGDIDEASARALAERHFGGWTGGAPPKVDFPPPSARVAMRVIVVHRPKSVQSDVFVASLAPERHADVWARIRVANQVLGGGVASRLFDDVRERRSLAYRTNSQIVELGHGAQPLLVYAGTESHKTTETARRLLENIAAMVARPPSAEETALARRFLSDVFAVRMETIGAIADLIVTQTMFGLADGYWDTYRTELRATNAKDIEAIAPGLFGGKKLLVVAGDSDVIGSELTRFGDVTVVDPEKDFQTIKSLPAAKP